MSDYLRAVILGLIEGLTEFVPVSSTGHMLLAQPWLGVDPEQPLWKVFLWVSQFAAILAVIVYFGRDLWRRTLQTPISAWQRHILTKLFVAMVPTVVLALLLHDFLERWLENPPSIAVALIVGAVAMELIDRRFRRDVPQTLEDVTLRQAFAIGVLQCLSMWPGISRSGASIMGGMALGLTPRVATEFSFYLAIPTMLAAAARTLWKYRHDLNVQGWDTIALGCAVSFVVALAVCAWLMNYVKRHRFTVFSAYRVLLGAAVLAAWWFGLKA